MSVILCSHGLLDWFNKTILFYMLGVSKWTIKKLRLLCSIKAGRKILENFKFQNYDIECVSDYKYLGIHFTASGSFHFAQTELCKKTLKA